MARVLDQTLYAEKRNDILDAARRLIETRGYAQMTIQDILNELQISKGAFYHYFDSKQALVEGLIERMQAQTDQALLPIVHDEQMPALEKLRRVCTTLTLRKTAHKPLALALLRVWYADDNAVLRQRTTLATQKQITPLLTAIIQQGVREDVFTTPYPDRIAGAVLALTQAMMEAIYHLILFYRDTDIYRTLYSEMKAVLAVYTDAVERVLGAEPGSIVLLDVNTLVTWIS